MAYMGYQDNKNFEYRPDVTVSRETDGYQLFCADQREDDDTISLDQRWKELSQTHKQKYKRRAIVINSKLFEEDNEDNDDEDDDRNNIPQQTMSSLEHLVSPDAIREAEREEEEEKLMGNNAEHHPFSAYPSIHSMKQQEHRRSSLSPPPTFSPNYSDSPSPSSSATISSSIGDTNKEDGFVSLEDANNGKEKQQQQEQQQAPAKQRLKRPPNAYLLFNRDMRRRLLEESPKMTVAEISKEIGERWKRLEPEQRQNYMQQAALIKQDHLKNHPDFIYTRRSKAQLAEARKFSRSRKGAGSKSMATVAAGEGWTAGGTNHGLVPPKRRRKSGMHDGPRDPRGRKKKRYRHPTAPKHPMSGFLFFLAAVRPEVARQYPGSTVGPISKVIASQWRDMTDEARIPWLQMAEEDKARYAREMQVYTASLEKTADEDGSLSAADETGDDPSSCVAAVVHMVNNSSSSSSSTHAMYDPVPLSSSVSLPPKHSTSSGSSSSHHHYHRPPGDMLYRSDSRSLSTGYAVISGPDEYS
ncbi:hypothetical protein BJV82DRAFT_349141 [Fennellomyces sp. T-0311]|nr:hypothetical protein BJV82DRAFT_349141 [Fennellomyces sp. T-0311]